MKNDSPPHQSPTTTTISTLVLATSVTVAMVTWSYLTASRSAPRSLRVVCLMSSKLFSSFTQLCKRERERERNEMTEEVLLFVWMFVCAWYISLIGAVTQALNIIHSNIISETVSPCSHADCTALPGLCRVIHQMWHGQLLGWYKMSKRSGARTAVVMAIDPSLAPDPWREVRSLNETCWYGQSGN